MRGRRRFDTWLAALATLLLFAAARSSRRPAVVAAEPLPPPQAAPPQPRPPEPTPSLAAGMDAETPAAIPPRGWWQVAKRVGADFSSRRILAEAAGVTFYTLLGIFPALAALVSLYGLFASPKNIEQQVAGLSGILPGGGMQLISSQLHSLASASNGALGFGLIVGIAVSLWSARQGISGLFDALNVVYGETEKRGFFKLAAITLGFTLGIILFLVVAIAVVVASPIVLQFIGLQGIFGVLLKFARWPAMLVIVALLLAVIYRYGPSREHARWQWVSWGSGFAAIAWIICSLLFTWYVASFGSYNRTYGSLGAVIGFMTWIWISAAIVLLGGALNAELEAQTARDTTTGAPLPRGSRGAVKADELAA